ncbi:MAG: ribosome assembly RNA-binding protein YhbY [Eubacteriales bacterium]|nr:ribosome assembly RNA-binding protein YhbY [Eubacteriales bacterium]
MDKEKSGASGALQITTKERAWLRAQAIPLETIFQIGKGGVSEETVRQIGNALEARELIKCRVLENSGYTSREACDLLAEACGAAAVQAVGSRFVLYRPSEKNKRIDLKNAGRTKK